MEGERELTRRSRMGCSIVTEWWPSWGRTNSRDVAAAAVMRKNQLNGVVALSRGDGGLTEGRASASGVGWPILHPAPLSKLPPSSPYGLPALAPVGLLPHGWHSELGVVGSGSAAAVSLTHQSSSSLPNSSDRIATITENCYNHEKQTGTVTENK
jgi:hypothetical protein